MARQKKKNNPKKSGQKSEGSWRSWYESKSPVLRFGLKFGVLIALFYGLMAMPFFDRFLYSYLEACAWASNIILHAFGESTHVSNVIITSPRFSIAIRRGCDAVEPTALFWAAILAFRAPLKQKLVGMLVGAVLFQLLNLVRIVTLYWIGIHFPGFFDSAHMEIWPTIFIIAVILLFVYWKDWTFDRPKENVAA